MCMQGHSMSGRLRLGGRDDDLYPGRSEKERTWKEDVCGAGTGVEKAEHHNLNAASVYRMCG